MDVRDLLRSEAVAWAGGAAAILAVAGAVHAYVGWLGIGLVGLVGMVVSTRLSLHGGHAVADSDHGTGAVGMLAKQVDEKRSHIRPEEKMAAQAEKERGSRVLFLINTAFIGMMALGFGLFLLHRI